MSSSTRLLVLGVVRIFQPVHGYDVRRELMQWRAHEWASAAPGSIYNALKSLTKDGLLEVVGTQQVGGRPERTSYRLTRVGEEELASLLYDTWWNVRPPIDPLMPGLSLLGEVPRQDAIAALEHRIAMIKTQLAQHDYLIANFDTKQSPDHVLEMLRLIRARVAAEIPWAEAFAARLRKGEYLCAGDDPGDAPWVHKPAKKRGKARSKR